MISLEGNAIMQVIYGRNMEKRLEEERKETQMKKLISRMYF